MWKLRAAVGQSLAAKLNLKFKIPHGISRRFFVDYALPTLFSRRSEK